MYELVQLTERDYYFDCPAKIGLVKTGESSAVLIDSGSDKDAGKKVHRALAEKGWELRAIYNTHSHADHTGGNRFLQEKTGCEIFARGMEQLYAAHPVLEPVGLYGGRPFGELRNKFLMAQESKVFPLTEEVLPAGMKMLDLPGHSFDMTGFVTQDGTAYIADCVFSEETLAKYGIVYLWDADAAARTLRRLQTLKAERFVPAHAPAVKDISELAALNLRAIEGLQAAIERLCAEPTAFEKLLKGLFDAYGQEMNVQQYALVGSTLRSCLSGLYERGRIGFEFRDNEMLWHFKGPCAE